MKLTKVLPIAALGTAVLVLSGCAGYASDGNRTFDDRAGYLGGYERQYDPYIQYGQNGQYGQYDERYPGGYSNGYPQGYSPRAQEREAELLRRERDRRAVEAQRQRDRDRDLDRRIPRDGRAALPRDPDDERFAPGGRP